MVGGGGGGRFIQVSRRGVSQGGGSTMDSLYFSYLFSLGKSD